LKARAKRSSGGEGDRQEREFEAVPARYTEALLADITHPQVPFRVFLTQDAKFHGLLVLRLATRRHRYNLSVKMLSNQYFSSSVSAVCFLKKVLFLKAAFWVSSASLVWTKDIVQNRKNNLK